MIKTLIKSTRITWASKTVNMYLLVLTYAYFANIIITNPYEIIEGLILVCVLWGALYSLNDLTDLEVDRKDSSKKERAFIQDNVEKGWIMLFFVVLGVIVFLVSFATMKPEFTVILALMLLNQVIYTVPPIRLKNTVLAPFASTATNTVLRIASCCVLLGNIFLVPLSVYFFMYMAGLATYVMYKSETGQASIVGVIAAVALVYSLYSGYMNFVQFAVAVLPAFLAAIPLYISLFVEKDKLVYLADVLYHQVAMVFFIICILYILF
ncbi:UbiA family prenyltransferase [Methanobacterium paludis]|uniref:UbiA prenyltransferase n=1 Tax=Methanobacterium paludis (strain DSM 25820 / JCM 18151 / SWAN1) TaxID=868131 RepID=F6D5M4_METPW|nr:UbiA family prenyltransferase [Methanobacterium paludis]AEG17641.1 UbiA prenyltransferase [Methanobacterium paludis]